VLTKRLTEDFCSKKGSDTGHNKSIEQARNRVEEATADVRRHCKPKDYATLGISAVALGLLIAASGGSGGLAFALAF
jgi:hypothetical protein